MPFVVDSLKVANQRRTLIRARLRFSQQIEQEPPYISRKMQHKTLRQKHH